MAASDTPDRSAISLTWRSRTWPSSTSSCTAVITRSRRSRWRGVMSSSASGSSPSTHPRYPWDLTNRNTVLKLWRMAMPTDIGIIDTMIGFPHRDMRETYRFITDQTKDQQSKEQFEFPVEYMFKDVPEKRMRDADDPVAATLAEMDRWGVERGLIGVGGGDDVGPRALKDHPDRFIPSA